MDRSSDSCCLIVFLHSLRLPLRSAFDLQTDVNPSPRLVLVVFQRSGQMGSVYCLVFSPERDAEKTGGSPDGGPSCSLLTSEELPVVMRLHQSRKHVSSCSCCQNHAASVMDCDGGLRGPGQGVRSNMIYTWTVSLKKKKRSCSCTV